MSDKTAALIEAHLNYEMSKLNGAGLISGLEDEIKALYADLDKRCLNDFVTAEQFTAILVDNMINRETTDGMREIISHITQQIDSLDAHNKARVDDLISAEEFKRIVNKVLTLDQARHALIHEIMQNSLYTKLISEVIYNAIKNFMLDEENGVANRLPGATSMMKLGKGVMSLTMPKMESNIDKMITRYINANIKKSVDLSESIINRNIDSSAVDKLIDEVWEDFGSQQISKFFSYIEGQDIEEFSTIFQDVWKDMQKSDYMKNFISELVTAYFKEYGDKPIGPLLAELGYPQDYVIAQNKKHMPQLIETDVIQEYLKSRIEIRLRNFYESDECKKILLP